MSEQRTNDSFSNNQNTPLLNIEIQLTETESAKLVINDDDVIDDKIISFCNEYNLSNEIKEIISEQVTGQLENQISKLEDTLDNEDIEANKDHNSTNKSKHIKHPYHKNAKHYSSNKGEELYKRYLEKKPKREALIKRLEQEKLEEELKEAVFKPSINTRSRRLVSKSKEKIEDRLLSYGRVSQENLIKERKKKSLEDKKIESYRPTLPLKSKMLGDLRRRMRIEEMAQNISGINPSYLTMTNSRPFDISFSSFDNKNSNRTPNKSIDNISNKRKTKGTNNSKDVLNTELSKKSSMTMKQSSSFDNTSSHNKASLIFHNKIPIPQIDPEHSLHDYLYVESKLIQDKKDKKERERMKEICPFTPHIPDKVRKLVNNRQETQGQFIKRMHKTKLHNEEIYITKIKNSKTERPLFRPIITRGPKNDNARTVSVNLDSFYDKKLIQNKTEIHQKEICNTLEKKKMFLERSMEIILKMKYEKYKEIFNCLDSDNDGLISSRNIKLSQLDHEVLEALTPLLDELQASKESMTFKDFCLKADKELASKIFSNK